MILILRIPRPRFAPGYSWDDAFRETMWAVALAFLYLVFTAWTCLYLGVSALEETAGHGPEVVKQIPFWRPNP